MQIHRVFTGVPFDTAISSPIALTVAPVPLRIAPALLVSFTVTNLGVVSSRIAVSVQVSPVCVFAVLVHVPPVNLKVMEVAGAPDTLQFTSPGLSFRVEQSNPVEYALLPSRQEISVSM